MKDYLSSFGPHLMGLSALHGAHLGETAISEVMKRLGFSDYAREPFDQRIIQ